MKKLDPKVIWLFFVNFLVRGFFLLIVFCLYLFAMFSKGQFSEKPSNNLTSVLIGLVIIIFALIFSYIWAVLSYNAYRYELSPSGFKKESGVIWKKYVTIPYNRIQNVDIFRGIIARILGLSDLQIQTAGFSATRRGGVSAEGRLPGITKEDADKIRDELIKRSNKNNLI